MWNLRNRTRMKTGQPSAIRRRVSPDTKGRQLVEVSNLDSHISTAIN